MPMPTNFGDGNTHPENFARDPRNAPPQPNIVTAPPLVPGQSVAKGQAVGNPNGPGVFVALHAMTSPAPLPQWQYGSDDHWKFSLGPS